MSTSELVLEERTIGLDHPCFIVAEVGVNHDGDLGLALKLVDLAAECGADAVKFQVFQPEALVSSSAASAPYQEGVTGKKTQAEVLDELVLPVSSWPEVLTRAKQRGLVFLATAFDEASIDLLDAFDVAAFKVASGELNNILFLEDVARRGRPLIISTGIGTLEEVERALAVTEAAPAVAILHCVTAYPAASASANLRAISTMLSKFSVPVGWSDHTIGGTTAVAAVALGASILEKHITIDRTRPGPDHAASADPTAFAEYVAAVRECEAALGNGVKVPSPEEEANRFYVRRSVHAARNLPEGHVLGPGDVTLLRPEAGLPADARWQGLRLVRPVRRGDPITVDDVT